MSCHDIGIKYAMNEGTVLWILHKKNVKIRSFSEAGKLRYKNHPNSYGKIIHGRLTNIELKVLNQLLKLNYDTVIQYHIKDKFYCDFYLPELNTIIECDGDYWHNMDKQIKKDACRDKYLLKCGYKVVRVKGSIIMKKDFDLRKYL